MRDDTRHSTDAMRVVHQSNRTVERRRRRSARCQSVSEQSCKQSVRGEEGIAVSKRRLGRDGVHGASNRGLGIVLSLVVAVPGAGKLRAVLQGLPDIARHVIQRMTNQMPAVFGQVTAGFGQMPAVFGQMPAVSGQGTAVFGQMTAVFCQMTAVFDQMTAVFGQMTAVFNQVTAVFGHVPAVFRQVTAVLRLVMTS